MLSGGRLQLVVLAAAIGKKIGNKQDISLEPLFCLALSEREDDKWLQEADRGWAHALGRGFVTLGSGRSR